MSKKLTKILITGVLAIMCMGIFAGCGSDIATDRVSVGIKAEFKEKFLAEEFTVEDFEWDNVEKIEYEAWYSKNDPEIGYVTITLKKHGIKRVKDAVAHFNTLDFGRHNW